MGEVDTSRSGDPEVGGDSMGFPSCNGNVASVGEEIRHLSLEEGMPVEGLKTVTDDFEFLGLSPLIVLGGFDADKDCCNIVTSGSVADCELIDISKEADWMNERCETLIHDEPRENWLFSIATREGLSLEYEGRQEEKSEVGGSVGPSDKVAPLSVVEGLASVLSTASLESCSSEPPSEAANGTSTKPVLVFRRSNPKRAASLRSSQADKKPGKSTRTKSVASKCTKSIDTAAFLSIIVNRGTRKRSYSRTATQRLPWGALENLGKIFKQNSEFVQDRRPKKGSSGSGKQKRETASRGGSSRVSKTKIRGGMIKTTSDVQYNLGEQTSRARVKSLQCDGLHGDKDLESTLTHDTYAENILGECPGVSFRSGTGGLVEPVDDNRLLDPGTSPDSDVYHPTVDVGSVASGLTTPTNQASGEAQCASATKLITQFSLPADVSTYMHLHTDHKKRKKGKKKGKDRCLYPLSEYLYSEQEFSGLKNLNKATETTYYRIPEWNQQEGFNGSSAACSESVGKLRNGQNCNDFRVKSPFPEKTDWECHGNDREMGLENQALSGKGVETADSEPGALGVSLLTHETKVHEFAGGTRAELNKGRSTLPDSATHKRRNSNAQKKKKLCKSGSKSKTKEKNGTYDACREESEGTSFPLGITSKANTGSKVLSVDVSSFIMAPIGDELPPNESCHPLEAQSSRPRAAWVSCDDCRKWRCIPAALADVIDETNCKWTCKDNKDKQFAECSIPQEKTNAEINAELELSDASGGEDSYHAQLNLKAIEPPKPSDSKPVSWMLIKSNLFLHRNRKSQTIDEIMVCHCKPSLDGRLGCGEECLNRMLNIECVRGTCPCGDLCSNQQFQKRKYAKFKWFRCGKKGHGLQLQESVSSGQFLIEYVGEVLDFTAYEARQRSYASLGQKHFYFMTLNGGEVIDACAKGNFGRFINHSCDPNCRTEKWMVNGEVCIGLFAIRDIKKGEEVTFNYQFVRVFGAAAKKCFCGAAKCRGYIGDDPLDAEGIVQGDSDEEYPEPVMVRGDGKRDLLVEGTASPAIDAKVVKHAEIPIKLEGGEREVDIDEAVSNLIDVKVVEHKEIPTHLGDGERDLDMEGTLFDPIEEQLNRYPSTLQELEDTSDPVLTKRASSDAEVLECSSHSSNSIQTEEAMCIPTSGAQPLVVSPGTSSTVNESMTNSLLLSEKLITNSFGDKLNLSKPYPRIKSSRPKVSIKKAKLSAKTPATHKVKQKSTNINKGHFGRVEENLDCLLDSDGGISKKTKDATRHYLKLLVVTAADGDNTGGIASQSTRDLSLILDALLKTKSRTVLVDIISKNGLQLLHNIMMQNRNNFNRTPIIRKLLKVLEFLALNGILTEEHINSSPPCSGKESFKDSIIFLTRRHDDMQVQQIARLFIDKWIPRTTRRAEPSGRDDGQLDSHSHCRWYQSPQGVRGTNSEILGCASSLTTQQVSTSVPLTSHSTTSGTRKRKSRWNNLSDPDLQEAASKFMKSETRKEDSRSCDDLTQKNVDDEAPPGFSSPCKNIPTPIAQKDDEAPPGFGSPRILPEASIVVMASLQERYLPQLAVSYGMPADLMQQLGTHETEGGGGPNPRWAVAPGIPFVPFPPLPSYPRVNPNSSSMAQRGNVLSHRTDLGVRNYRFRGRARPPPSNGEGRRVFGPQRWDNNERFERRRPSWSWGGGNSSNVPRGRGRNGPSSVCIGNTRGFNRYHEGVSNGDFSTNFH